MNRNILLFGAAMVALISTAAHAADSHEQMCTRWAGHQNLQGKAQAEYIKDCQLDLRVPDKADEEGDE